MNLFKDISSENTPKVSHYVITDETETSSFFELLSHEDVRNQYPAMVTDIHCHDVYTIVAFEKGHGCLCVGCNECEVKKNTLYFIPPGQLHKFVNVSSDAVGGTIYFTDGFLEQLPPAIYRLAKYKLFSKTESNQFRQISVTGNNRLKEDFDRILFRLSRPLKKQFQTSYLSSLLSVLLIDLIENAQSSSSDNADTYNKDMNVFLDFLDCIEKNFKQIHTVDKLVNEMHVSMSTLVRAVKSVSNRTPASLLNERLSIEAQRMLNKSPEMRIKEIACSLGFADISNFAKFFRRQVGMSPVKFRQKAK